MKILTYTILCCSLLMSCGNGKEKTKEITNVNQEDKIEKAYIGVAPKSSSPVTIQTASVDGNIMTIEVEYSGGCKDHDFDLIGSAAIMKSLPAQRGIELVHKLSDDTCRELVTEELEFDISEFAYQKEDGSEIMLLLNGYKGKISYVYEGE